MYVTPYWVAYLESLTFKSLPSVYYELLLPQTPKNHYVS